MKKVFSKMVISIFTLGCLTLNAASWEQQTGWVMAYEHDENGNKVNGNLDSLLTAIRNGADVKVGYSYSSEEAFFKCNWVYINNSNSAICMNTDHISKLNFNNEGLNFNSNAYNGYILVNTYGERAISRWFVGQHTKVGDSKDRVSMKWFVSNK